MRTGGSHGDSDHRNNTQDVVSGNSGMRTGCRHSHQFSRQNDVLGRKAGSYLMAAKGMLNKVNPRDLTLFN